MLSWKFLAFFPKSYFSEHFLTIACDNVTYGLIWAARERAKMNQDSLAEIYVFMVGWRLEWFNFLESVIKKIIILYTHIYNECTHPKVFL